MARVKAKMRGNKAWVGRRSYGLEPAPKGFVWSIKAGDEIEGLVVGAPSVGKITNPPIDLFRPAAKHRKRFHQA